MDELVNLLDDHLRYVRHELRDETFHIYVESNQPTATCPFCETLSTRVHSKYERTFQDLPIQGKKVLIVLQNRKWFCDQAECGHATFAERFEFIAQKAKKTQRLEKEIVRLSLNCSSVAASEILSSQLVQVGKSTICELIKKNRLVSKNQP